MSTITQVEPQKALRLRSGQVPRRFNIYIDGQFAFGADEDLVVNYRLVPGKIIEQKDLEKLIFEAEVGKLMEKMYNLFSFRMRSEKEIRDYLKNLSFKRKILSKGQWTSGPKDQAEISPLVIDLLIERLKQKGMLNDLEFAKAWVEGRRRSKNLGERALKMELMRKGIGREIVDEIFNDQFSISNEEELAKKALEKKMRSWKNLDPKKRKQKAMEFLMRKGFDWDLIKRVIDEKN